MNNVIQRKITSLTLMTIMLAGGVAIGFPGMEPAAAAGGELYVSAEQNGNFAGIQVIEIVVSDPNRSSTEDSEGIPNVEINGDDVLMAQGDDGAWYAYVANKLAIDTYEATGNSITGIYGGSALGGSFYAGSDSDQTYGQSLNFLDGFKSLSAVSGTTDVAVSATTTVDFTSPEFETTAVWTLTHDGSELIDGVTITIGSEVYTAGADDTADFTFLNSGNAVADFQALFDEISGSNAVSTVVTAVDTSDTVMTITSVVTGTAGNITVTDNTSGSFITVVQTITAVNADTVTINSIVYTGVDGSETGAQFDATSDTNAATSLVAALVSQDSSITGVVGTDTSTVDLTVDTAGALGNTTPITSSDNGRIGTAAFSGGVNEIGSVDNNPAIGTSDWPFIQTYSITSDSDVTITYGTGSTAETVVIEYSYNDDADVSLDRQYYPDGAFIFIDLNDSLLNLSPVADDYWSFDGVGNANYTIGSTLIQDVEYEAIGFEEGPFVFDTSDSSYVLSNTSINSGIVEITENVVLFRQSSTDDNLFVNYDRADVSNLKVTDDAKIGAITYNDSHSIISDTFSGVLTFLTVVDEWLSGVELDIELVDEDRNLNSKSDETMSILEDEVPYIIIGEPATLGSSDLVLGNYAISVFTVATPAVGDKFSVGGQTFTAKAAGFGFNANEYQVGVNSEVASEAATSIAAAINLNTDDGVEAIATGTKLTIRASSIGNDGNSIVLTELTNSPLGGSSTLSDGSDKPTTTTESLTDSQTIEITTNSGDDWVTVTLPWQHTEEMTGDYVFRYINYDFTSLGGSSGTHNIGDPDDITDGVSLDVPGIEIDDYSNSTHAIFVVEVNDSITTAQTIYFDILSFGQTADISDGVSDGQITDNVDRVNDAIYRFELEETDDNTATFEGTVEYLMINQLNVFDNSTYASIATTGDSIVIIVNDDMDGTDAITVSYNDIDSTSNEETISVQEDANTHSGVIELDSTSYSSGNTITVTLTDADLNTDSDTIQVFNVDPNEYWVGNGKVWLSQLLINDSLYDDACIKGLGLFETGFTLVETDDSSGIFVGTLKLPALYCDTEETSATTNGLDLEFEYQDYSDASGEPNESSDSASIRSNTGSVSLDRSVYPTPFDTFATYDGVKAALMGGDVIITIAVNDPDFNISASGEDTMSNSTLGMIIARGSNEIVIEITDPILIETDPASGIFEVEVTIPQDGSYTGLGGTDGLIYQGDIITVTYTDPADASGNANSVTDSATFDLRNAVLQTDKSVYIIGSDAIITLIEPDLNLDSGTAETWSLDLINWDSDAGSENLSSDIFDANTSGLRETGDDTGIFQVVIEIPRSVEGDKLERGEQITLEYQDNGPAGADFVGDDDEDISVTLYTSNFGATVELDQKVYTWTDKVYITIVAPDHNFDSDSIDEIGNDSDSEINISTRSNELKLYKLVETGADTGIFTGEVILTGFAHDADGDTSQPTAITSASASGPTDGFLGTSDDDGLTVSFEFSDGEVVMGSSLVRWNIGEVQWLEASYPASGTGVIRVIDPDMNLNPESVNSFDIDVWSDTAAGGISLRVTETNEATGIFEGTVSFTVNQGSSGSRLAVSEGDTVIASYEDHTLPDPYSTADELDITATTLIGTVTPPLERAPAANLRTVDAFGNSLDSVSVDQQVQITADLSNGQDRDQDFAYLVQIQSDEGVTVSLAWITGSLGNGQSFSPALSWIPTLSGTYTATAFVWQSIDNPTALSPPVVTTINVS